LRKFYAKIKAETGFVAAAAELVFYEAAMLDV
jgi:hypothetical protein